MKLSILTLMILLMLVGCQQGAVVFAPTPVPDDLVPEIYTHPSNVFSLVLPRSWSVFSQNQTTLASASFSVPNMDEPLLSIAVVNIGRPIEINDLGDYMIQYQTQIRPDLARYQEQERQAMGDGSWRISGLRINHLGNNQSINTFIQRHGSFLTIMEVLIPSEPQVQAEIQAIINTLEVHQDIALPASGMVAFSAFSNVNLEIINVANWTTLEGVFFITGEVVNRGTQPVSNVPVRAVLLDENDNGIAEAVDTLMTYTLPPGGFAPFSLRFGQGRPTGVKRYAIYLGDETWDASQAVSIIPTELFGWTDGTSYNQNGQLIVTGTITNLSPETAYNPRVIVTLVDETQKVIASGFVQTQAETLAPNESSDYSLLIQDMGARPANYIVNVQALRNP